MRGLPVPWTGSLALRQRASPSALLFMRGCQFASSRWGYAAGDEPLKEQVGERQSAILGKLSKCCFSWNKNLWYTVYVSSMTSDVAVSPVWDLVHRQQ